MQESAVACEQGVLPEQVGLEQGHGCDHAGLPACGVSVQVQRGGDHACKQSCDVASSLCSSMASVAHIQAVWAEGCAALPVTFSVSAAVPAPQQYMLGAMKWIFSQFLSATVDPAVDLVSAPSTMPSCLAHRGSAGRPSFVLVVLGPGMIKPQATCDLHAP